MQNVVISCVLISFERILDGRIVGTDPRCCYFHGFNRFLKVFWTDGSSGLISGRTRNVFISLTLMRFSMYSGRTARLDGSEMLFFQWFEYVLEGILDGRIVGTDLKC